MEYYVLTNNRDISIQIANRFLDSKSYASINCPEEFKKEYLPLIEQFHYNKGSLMQSNIETALSDFSSNIFALPPVKELSFMTWNVIV